MECIEKEKFLFDKVDSSALPSEGDHKYDKEAANYATRKVLKRK